MQSYAESKGKPKFDWWEFLRNDPASISDASWEYAEELAQSWVTCACGTQCDIIPRKEGLPSNTDGSPVDEVLATMGGDEGFFGAIRNRNLEKAADWLYLIEIRASQLIEKHRGDISLKIAELRTEIEALQTQTKEKIVEIENQILKYSEFL